ncbi:MAG: hypothetical protein H6766_03290 [Candidatus Peribacteria bacterium]|nr:MAG: hypothetical protein H6766_03290 [Candidatus Peribacteria bacterium]
MLVAFASYRSAVVNFFRRRWQVFLFTVLFVVSLFATLSRGAVVAFGVQMIAGIILLWNISRARKLLFSIFV